MRFLAIVVVSVAAAAVAHARAVSVSIMNIQGAGNASPFAADTVTTGGIVTAVGPDGFWMQDPAGDNDPATSDAVFVFTGPAPRVSPGDEVRAEGPVREYLPGDDAENLTVTELHRPRVSVVASGRALPSPVVIGPGGRLPPARIIDDDGLTRYEPERDAIDFWESLEGMRVRVASPRVAQATNAFGEVWVAAGGTTTSARGALPVTANDARTERVQIDDTLLPQAMPPFDVGDALADVTGVVGYRFGNYEVLPGVAPDRVSGHLAREIDALPRGAGRLRVASFNVRNLGPDDGARAEELARHIVSHLGAPEIIGLQEILDDSGTDNDGTVGAARTLGNLCAAIQAAGGPRYDFREVAPADGMDGGVPGGNIRVALLFDPARVSFADRGDVSGTAETRPVSAGGAAALTRSPGRIAPGDPAWVASRKPLAGEFRAGDGTLFVVVAHFVSRSRGSSSYGSIQPPRDPDGGRRNDQAARVAEFVAGLLAIDPGARVVVMGDLNDDWFSAPLSTLAGAGLHNLPGALGEPERYSLLYDGRGQLFDHILVSPALREGAVADVVHIEAEFARGSSDHDPVVASLLVGEGAGGTPRLLSPPRPNPFASSVEMDMTGGGDHPEADVFDVRGRRVGSPRITGGILRWDGRNDAGRSVPAGVYWIRVRAGGASDARPVVRLRVP